MEKLVFLHIEKTAGTSQRALFEREMSRYNVFWYGRESKAHVFEERESENSRVIGGHRDYRFYNRPDYGYLSVVRDPVSRVISLYHYLRTAEYDQWKDHGLNVKSLKKTLRGSTRFQQMIQGGQCRYLSGLPFFEPTLVHIQSNKFLVGTLDQVSKFNGFLAKQLGWPQWEPVYKNIGEAGYRKTVDVDRGTLSLIRELVVEDQLLYDYLNNECDGLLTSISVQDWDSYTISSKVKKPRDLQLFVERLELGEDNVIAGVELRNTGFEVFPDHSEYYVGFRVHAPGGAIIREARAAIISQIDKGDARYFLLTADNLAGIRRGHIYFGVVDVRSKRWLGPGEVAGLTVILNDSPKGIL